ncbi:hyperosmotically inducible protein [Nitrosomonas sp. Nm84]|uniref:BON domain-containing protein n=1 Tax=Nitrosomonas sp. Nm84 TaxID=200124 RepID=UPI000D75A3D3|nr:BON domain-containing protein [Nitrosomonas sp. Nm84]PXW81720.1 hyperosmotically inducible protein [Nitrosomonas sp. Nm84]
MRIRYKLFTLVMLFMTALMLIGCENYAERTHKSWVPPPSAPVYDDSTIFARIASAVQSDPVLQGTKIDIKVNDGNVVLSGTVKNDDQLTRVNMHTWIVDGVKKVDNQIVKN